jgi:hypothetical protein
MPLLGVSSAAEEAMRRAASDGVNRRAVARAGECRGGVGGAALLSRWDSPRLGLVGGLCGSMFLTAGPLIQCVAAQLHVPQICTLRAVMTRFLLAAVWKNRVLALCAARTVVVLALG